MAVEAPEEVVVEVASCYGVVRDSVADSVATVARAAEEVKRAGAVAAVVDGELTKRLTGPKLNSHSQSYERCHTCGCADKQVCQAASCG